MINYILLAAISAALSGIGFMLMQPVLAIPNDPTQPFAPGIRAEAEGTDAYDVAPGQQYEHGFSPTDPYKFSPGFLFKGTCTPGQDICG